MKIVLLDVNALGKGLDFSELDPLGDVTLYGSTTPEQIVERAKGATVLVSNKINYTKEVLEQLGDVKLIALTSTGTNTVDLKAAVDCGIQVSNIIGYSTESVVMATFAMLFYMMMPLAIYDTYVKGGDYVEDDTFRHFDYEWHQLSGQTLGIVGMGDIGTRVAAIAKAFGAHVLHYSSSGKGIEDVNDSPYEQVDFSELLERSDIISIHAPLTDRTLHLFDKDAFSNMKTSAILVNMGRGPIVDEEALVDALNEGQIYRAGLDVLSKEPMVKNHPLECLKDKNKLYITPHIGWASLEARRQMVREVYMNIEAFKQGSGRNIVLP